MSALVPLLILIFGFFLPLGKVLEVGLTAGLSSIWSDPWFWSVVRFTYWQAFLSALLSAVIGVPGAIFLSENRFPGRRLLWSLVLIPFSLPPILFVLSFLAFWGASGFIRTNPYGWWGILAGHSFFNFGLFVKAVGTALQQSDRSMEKAALSLGASRTRCFFSISLPSLLPAIGGSFCLAFLFCSMSFLIVLLLGGGPRFTTVEVAIYEATKMLFDEGRAAGLALTQIVAFLVCYGVYLFFFSPRHLGRRSAFVPLYQFRSPAMNRIAMGFYSVLLLFWVGAPLLALVASGLASAAKLDWGSLRAPLLRTVSLAAQTALLSTLLGVGLARAERYTPWRGLRRVLSTVAMFPLGVSSLVLTLGWMLCYSTHLEWFRGSLFWIALLQAIGCVPLTYRCWHEGMMQLSPALIRSAASLGAGPSTRWWTIELPLLRKSCLLALALAASFSIGEMGTLLMFYSESTHTLTMEIYRLMGRYRFDEAYGVGTCLLILTGALYLALGKFEKEAI